MNYVFNSKWLLKEIASKTLHWEDPQLQTLEPCLTLFRSTYYESVQ